MSSDEGPLQVVPHQLAFRLLEVLRVTDLSPNLRRITLGGPELDGFRSDGPDDGSRMFFPPDPHDRSWVPTVDGSSLVFPEDIPRPPGREFTPRRHDPQAGELDFEFVIHDGGPSSDWAANAEPGHLVGVSGPRRSRVIAGKVDWYLLAGDETALPSIARRIEELAPGTLVTAIVEVASPAHEIALESPADLEIMWLHRDGASEPSELLAQAIRELEFPAGNIFAWAAGETSSIAAVRRHLLRERELSTNWMRMTGYWKRSIANWDHHQPFEE